MSQQNVAETAFDPTEEERAPQSYIAELNPNEVVNRASPNRSHRQGKRD